MIIILKASPHAADPDCASKTTPRMPQNHSKAPKMISKASPKRPRAPSRLPKMPKSILGRIIVDPRSLRRFQEWLRASKELSQNAPRAPQERPKSDQECPILGYLPLFSGKIGARLASRRVLDQIFADFWWIWGSKMKPLSDNNPCWLRTS